MKEITVITTGGTIGSILRTESVTIDMTEQRISDEIKLAKDKLGFSVSVVSPLNKNSEDLSPSDWIAIINSLIEANNSDSCGVVVTHGTDTLVYSVAAALAYRHLWKKKICFTGSYYSPDHPSSDTSLSLLASLEFVASPHPANGVYVAFRSNRFNSEARIIHGASLMPMNHNDLYFKTAYDEVVTDYSPKTGISDDISLSSIHSPSLDVEQVPSVEDIKQAQSKISLLVLYPGIDSGMLEAAAKGRDILIVQMYHSGTGPSDNENSDLLDFIKKISPTTTVLMATLPKKYINLPYDSTIKLKNTGAYIYNDLQVHFLYAFSILSLALNMTSSEITNKLSDFEI